MAFRVKQEDNSIRVYIDYKEYLLSEEWQKKRQAVLKREDYICQGCAQEKATQVHHTTYENIGDELNYQLLALCRGCHEKIHEKENAYLRKGERVLGFTLFKDNDMRWYGAKRINGTNYTVYIGKDKMIAAQKISAWLEKKDFSKATNQRILGWPIHTKNNNFYAVKKKDGLMKWVAIGKELNGAEEIIYQYIIENPTEREAPYIERIKKQCQDNAKHATYYDASIVFNVSIAAISQWTHAKKLIAGPKRGREKTVTLHSVVEKIQNDCAAYKRKNRNSSPLKMGISIAGHQLYKKKDNYFIVLNGEPGNVWVELGYPIEIESVLQIIKRHTCKKIGVIDKITSFVKGENNNV